MIARFFDDRDAAAPGEARGLRAARRRTLVPRRRPGDFAQALMDLGATICTPRKPALRALPVAGELAWLGRRRVGNSGGLAAPRREAGTTSTRRRGSPSGSSTGPVRYCLRQRAPWEGPARRHDGDPVSTEWSASAPVDRAGRRRRRSAAAGGRVARCCPGHVRHVFTHFELTLSVWAGQANGRGDPTVGLWVTPDKFGDYALPSLMLESRAARAHGKAAKERGHRTARSSTPDGGGVRKACRASRS